MCIQFTHPVLTDVDVICTVGWLIVATVIQTSNSEMVAVKALRRH